MIGLSGLLIINPLELFFLDTKFVFAQKTFRNYDFSEHIVIILFDEKSGEELKIDREGKAWREHIPSLLRILTREKAALITFDIEFGGEFQDTNNNVRLNDSIQLIDKLPLSASGSEELVASFKRAGNVIAGEITAGAVPPIIRASLLDLGNLHVVQINGLPRKIKLYPKANRQPAFSLAVARAYLNAGKQADASNPSATVPAFEAEEDFWVNFKYPQEYFPVFSLTEVLKSANKRLADPYATPLSIFTNKIVLIAKDLDRFSLPTTFDQKIFGAMFQAMAIESLLQKTTLARLPWYLNLVVLALVLAGFYLLMHIRAFRFRLFALIISYLFIWGVQYTILLKMSLWLDFASLLLGSFVLFGLYRFYLRRQLVQNLQSLETQFMLLENQTAKLAETGEMKQHITDTLVHDIKNSVAAVEGMINFLGQKYQNDKQTVRNLNAAFTACADIMNLSSNLLDTSRMETGQMMLKKEPCSFSTIRHMLDKFLVLEMYSHKQLEVELRGPESAGYSETADVTIDADHYLLERVVHNLLNNAFKYAPPAGKIRISASFEKSADKSSQPDNVRMVRDEVRLVFFNTGEPIAAAHRNLVFEKYGQVGEKRSKYSKGLGLFFCKLVMELHGGRIELESSAEGNAFILVFPESHPLQTSH
jgi:signal transduction histidine kinase